jgi:hypothetical protein
MFQYHLDVYGSFLCDLGDVNLKSYDLKSILCQRSKGSLKSLWEFSSGSSELF